MLITVYLNIRLFQFIIFKFSHPAQRGNFQTLLVEILTRLRCESKRSSILTRAIRLTIPQDCDLARNYPNVFTLWLILIQAGERFYWETMQITVYLVRLFDCANLLS